MGLAVSQRKSVWAQYASSLKRPFAILLVLTLLICLSSIQGWSLSLWRRRSSERLLHGLAISRRDLECRLVHDAKDKCDFVRTNCLDEEAGLFSYLELYYCQLPKAKPVAFGIMIVWLGLLFSTIGIAASDFFSINLSTIATLLGLSESVAGVTFLAFGNGSPDVFSTFAAMSTHSGSLAIGELIGAAGFITAVVAGSMAIVRPFKVGKQSFIRDVSFFVVAASFSMVFLADGRLVFWECAVMVIFYVLYVIIVVIWQWVLGRNRRRRIIESRSRDHFQRPEDTAHATDQVDEYEDSESQEQRRAMMDDFALLEAAGQPTSPDDPDDEDQARAREHWMSEISRNMRVKRPTLGQHRNTATTIRPSLVGALEFRAVLSSLEKSRNQQAIPIGLRRYSDDPTFTLAQQQQYHTRNSSNPQAHYLSKTAGSRDTEGNWPPYQDDEYRPNRNRAVSANDAYSLKPNQSFTRTFDESWDSHRTNDRSIEGGRLAPPQSNLLVPGQSYTDLDHSTGSSPAIKASSPKLSIDTTQRPEDAQAPLSENYLRPLSRPLSMHSLLPTTAASSPAVPFPPYYDDPSHAQTSSRPHSIHLPPPSLDPESFFRKPDDSITSKPLRWWPYQILPAPGVLASTLFPTLYSWGEKSFSERVLGLISAPTIFLLTITLPVVEPVKDDDHIQPNPGENLASSAATPQIPALLTAPLVEISSESEYDDMGATDRRQDTQAERQNSSLPRQDSPEIILNSEGYAPRLNIEPESIDRNTIDKEGWNRWLVSTQVFTAPLFVVLILWANIDDDHSVRRLLFYSACAMLGSSLVFAALVINTTEQKPPKYRSALCFVGFIVSIAWISTIAGEVVGVLKAIGVILGISDAILGLTIFAVGNSLGDLVANITVAKLGFPVMALSACFGGPMLNILLGIGLSGLYMTLKEGQRHDKSLDLRPTEPQPYPIEVSGTLIISGVTLLFTLVGLLIFVPLNGWIMDRKIGWSLVAVWSLSTIVNVIVEVTGVIS